MEPLSLKTAPMAAETAPAGLERPPGRGLGAVGRRLRRLGLWPYLAAMGPGLIAAMAGDDSGGIATYSSVGAQYGYSMLWAMLLIVVLLVLVQEMCARMGAVTGKGLSDLIRERFGMRWSALVTLALFLGNSAIVITEFVGIGAAAELFGIPRWLAVPPMALLIWWLVTKGSYDRVEKIFVLLSLAFLAYIITAFIVQPPWGDIVHAMLVPDLSKVRDAAYLTSLVAVIGTTISPYMQLYAQSSIVEKGVTPADYKYERVDTITGAVSSVLIASFIIIAAAATLHTHQIQVNSASDAALALAPLAGSLAEALFAVGLFGASMLAAAVLPLTTAYAVTEAIGFERGVSFSFREAPFFMGLFTFLIVLGTAVAMLPGLPIIPLLISTQIINGVLLPLELVFIMLLVNDKSLMGKYTNRRLFNVIAWAGIVVITVAVAAMFVTLVLPQS